MSLYSIDLNFLDDDDSSFEVNAIVFTDGSVVMTPNHGQVVALSADDLAIVGNMSDVMLNEGTNEELPSYLDEPCDYEGDYSDYYADLDYITNSDPGDEDGNI